MYNWDFIYMNNNPIKLQQVRARGESTMKTKLIKVMEEKWDYLIILDACRYDYFLMMYNNYFNGDLFKGISVSTFTLEWCLKSFKDYYPDVIYISGNPYINSKVKIGRFHAKKHFYKVVDVWDFGWNEILGTVPPEKINETTINFIKKFPNKRFIIHYLQPHEPFISFKYGHKGYSKPNPYEKNILQGLQGNQYNVNFEKIMLIINTLLMRTKLIKNPYQLRDILKLPPVNPMDDIRRIYGMDGLREAYKENLKIVLNNVAKLCKILLCQYPSKKIVITSDHGEGLGENGIVGHWPSRLSSARKDPILLEVPLLRVKTTKDILYTPKLSDVIEEAEKEKVYLPEEQDKIMERLRRLGYVE